LTDFKKYLNIKEKIKTLNNINMEKIVCVFMAILISIAVLAHRIYDRVISTPARKNQLRKLGYEVDSSIKLPTGNLVIKNHRTGGYIFANKYFYNITINSA
jgi:hypothetical protein